MFHFYVINRLDPLQFLNEQHHNTIHTLLGTIGCAPTVFKCDFQSCSFATSSHTDLQDHLKQCGMKQYTCKRLKSNDEMCGQLVSPDDILTHLNACPTHSCIHCVKAQTYKYKDWMCVDKTLYEFELHKAKSNQVADEIKSLWTMFKQLQLMASHRLVVF